ncbi:cytochrome P450 CYP736A12-like [Apium graveolens]|uniref:cytochrome P450 CYP736A12-like n=1 Tax=Apium graveolens TaxID=4045 RepID=UPI003D7AFFE7
MSTSVYIILLPVIGALCWFIIHLRSRRSKLPPGPWGIPFIGHLHMLGKLPHRDITKLSQKYGPIMYLRLGSIPTIVISSPPLIELFLKTHDTIFASRPKTQASKILSYDNTAIAFTEYGPYWRNVRKFCISQLLSTNKIESMAWQRKEELGFMVESLREAAATREVVNVSEKLAGLIEDMTCGMLFGKSRDNDMSKVIPELLCLHGLFNVTDYLPILGPFDLQGLGRRFKVAFKTIDKILESIIDDHEQDARNSNEKPDRDFVDVLLSLQNNTIVGYEQLSKSIYRSNVKALILDMIMGALDTSQNSIDWIMTELVRNQRVVKKLQAEIESVVGDSQTIEEEHLPNFNYLDMIIKESMRLHPIGPFLIPRESTKDIEINGYLIPKKSRILTNIWAVGRDPQIWSENVDEFIPERFMGTNIDFRGQDFQFTPFGSGRRGCPGMQLGLVNIKLVVAQLIHSFNWELPGGMSPTEMDMSETFGLTMPRAKHLCAIPCIRVP